MSLRDLATGEACAGQSGAGPSTLSAVADAFLPTSTTSLPFAAASASTNPQQSTTNSTTPSEIALLTGDIPAQLLHQTQHSHPIVAPPASGAATDLFERAFIDRPRLPHPPLPTHSHVSVQKHPHFADAFRDAVQPPISYPQQLHHNHHVDHLIDQFSRFDVDPSRGKAPIARPQFPPMHVPMPMPRHYPMRYAPPPMAYAQTYNPQLLYQQQPQQQQQQPEQSTTEVPQTAKSDSQSWGDEFTSLEGPAGLAYAYSREADVEDINVAEQLRYDDSFEDMYEAAFRDFASTGTAREEYRFAEREGEQKHARSALEALEEGVRLRQAGKLTMAVHAFEEAVNREKGDPHPPLERAQKAKAWYLLGVTLAETDDDATAITALQQGLDGYVGDVQGERRQDHPYLLGSLIALAVSFTNEQLQPQAFWHIKEWFGTWCRQNGFEEKELRGVSEQETNGTDLEDVFQDAGKAGAQNLLQKMNTACERAPQDADIRIVMGVLHNLNREYSKAAETLRHAVMLRPNDPGLWNKLGATLANGGESDDALRAYRRSVDINPALVRAWVNVGTAYSNRGEFPKAARYYLKSVAMAEEEATSASEKGIIATQDRMAHVWGYLRTTLISMSRSDILHLVDSRDIRGLRSHFTF